MSTLRELFHNIANWHNRITISAGCTRELLKSRPLDTLGREDLKKEHEKLVSILDKLESDAVSANQKVVELKEAIYKKLKPDEEI